MDGKRCSRRQREDYRAFMTWGLNDEEMLDFLRGEMK